MSFREEKHHKSCVERGVLFSFKRVVNMGAGLPRLGEVIKEEGAKTGNTLCVVCVWCVC